MARLTSLALARSLKASQVLPLPVSWLPSHPQGCLSLIAGCNHYSGCLAVLPSRLSKQGFALLFYCRAGSTALGTHSLCCPSSAVNPSTWMQLCCCFSLKLMGSPWLPVIALKPWKKFRVTNRKKRKKSFKTTNRWSFNSKYQIRFMVTFLRVLPSLLTLKSQKCGISEME